MAPVTQREGGRGGARPRLWERSRGWGAGSWMAGINAPHPFFCGCRGSKQGLQQEGDKPRFNFSLFWRLEVQDQGVVEPVPRSRDKNPWN